MRLLSDEIASKAMDALLISPSTEMELRDRKGEDDIAHKTMYDRLKRLEALGLIAYNPGVASGSGRPAGKWSLAKPKELSMLVSAAQAAAAP